MAKRPKSSGPDTNPSLTQFMNYSTENRLAHGVVIIVVPPVLILNLFPWRLCAGSERSKTLIYITISKILFLISTDSPSTEYKTIWNIRAGGYVQGFLAHITSEDSRIENGFSEHAHISAAPASIIKKFARAHADVIQLLQYPLHRVKTTGLINIVVKSFHIALLKARIIIRLRS
jgi:hypothetical protein